MTLSYILHQKPLTHKEAHESYLQYLIKTPFVLAVHDELLCEPCFKENWIASKI